MERQRGRAGPGGVREQRPSAADPAPRGPAHGQRHRLRRHLPQRTGTRRHRRRRVPRAGLQPPRLGRHGHLRRRRRKRRHDGADRRRRQRRGQRAQPPPRRGPRTLRRVRRTGAVQDTRLQHLPQHPHGHIGHQHGAGPAAPGGERRDGEQERSGGAAARGVGKGREQEQRHLRRGEGTSEVEAPRGFGGGEGESQEELPDAVNAAEPAGVRRGVRDPIIFVEYR
mmetsp:Transcript_28796/g.61099  ORF Transcript_28796/g.61099 Transcript_28796/m.61099 type:complete len:225 (+) Transcript_28796:593-1267(+)